MKRGIQLLGLAILFSVLSCRSPDEQRALHIGRIEVAAQNYGVFLPKVDQVDLFAFGRGATNSGQKAFQVSYAKGERFDVTNHITLTGEGAESFAEKWRKLRFYWGDASLCYEPGFGMRFSRNSKILFETAVCLTCSDFCLPTKGGPALCGFESRSPRTAAFSNAVAEIFSVPAP